MNILLLNFGKHIKRLTKKPKTSLKQALLLGKISIDFIEGHIFKVTLEINK